MNFVCELCMHQQQHPNNNEKDEFFIMYLCDCFVPGNKVT